MSIDMTGKISREEVLKLAKLARVEIGLGEAETLSHEFDSILKYVSEIKDAKLEGKENLKENFVLKNVMRDDTNPHESKIYTEKLLDEAPNREGGFVKVKKIL
ncbi:MAG: Asp-tRNA(Asn)/Glu-tRNA(Gln) amidotransferase subunit GatC [Minisyncoccota bacterium]